MSLIGVDISKAPTKSVFDKFKASEHYAYVITVCDETSAARCPIFPGAAKRVHWSFPDPSTFTGTWPEKMRQTIDVRNMIAVKIQEWCREICAEPGLCTAEA
jgi:arsenate reductase (thioredoxin)